MTSYCISTFGWKQTPQNSSYRDLIPQLDYVFIKQMLVDFLLQCFLLEELSKILLEVTHAGCTPLIKLHGMQK